MSRYYKKQNIVKDKNRNAQKQGSKVLRSLTKSKIKSLPLDDIILPEDKSEVVNDYNVTDWKHKNKKGKGKKNKLNK